MKRLALSLVAVVLLLGATAVPAQAGKDSGWLYVKRFVPDHQRSEFKGFVEPKLYVYADGSGELLPAERPGGHYRPGELVELPEGWYQVELAHSQEKANRWRYYVKAGKVTIVRSGLVMLATVPARDQPRDVCKRWRAVMFVSVRDAAGQLQLVMTNQVEEADDFGMLQLHEGTYAVSFNGLRAEMEIKADKTLPLPTAQIGPISHSGYRLSVKKDDSSDNPSVRLCEDRATQVLGGTYWGSYWVDTMEAPYRRRQWEEQVVAPAGGGRYKKAPRDAPAKRAYRGDGSRPTRVIEGAASETNPIPTP